MLNEEILDNKGKKIISYLDKDPEVSSSVESRLEFARSIALLKMKKAPAPKFPFSLSPFTLSTTQKVAWVTGAALALAILSLSSDLMKVSEDSNDEITYHRQADKLPSYIVDEL